MSYRLFEGDCLKIMPQIPTGSINMILCDLPYGTTRCDWDTAIPLELLWEQYKRIIKPNGAIVLTGCEPFSSLLRISNLDMFKYDWIWDKVKGTGFLNAKRQPMRNHEIVSVFYEGQSVYNPQMTSGHCRKTAFRLEKSQTEVYGKMKNNLQYDSTDRYPRSIQIFSMDTQKEHLHPTQKPVALFEYLIRTYTNESDTVLDNCAGSGTTAVAAKRCGRNSILIEQSPEYCQVIRNRMADLNNKLFA